MHQSWYRWPAAASIALQLSVPVLTVQEPSSADAAAAAVLRLADDVVAGIKRHNPEVGTLLGLPDAQHGRIGDNSLEARERRHADEDGWRRRLDAVDARAIEGRPEWVIHGFLMHMLASAADERVCEAELWNVNQMRGWPSRYGSIARIQPIESAAERQQALDRFRALAAYADREIVNLREGLRQGYAAPRGNVEQVINQMSGFAADDSPYFAPAERTGDPAFAAAWREMFRTELAPAFRRYASFLRDEYLPKARETVGISELPDGAACYAARLRQMTTIGVTAAEVHRTGLAELEAIRAEERVIAQRLFKTTDLDQAFARLEEPDHRWENREAAIAAARAAAARAAGAMPGWFRRLPKTPVIITPIPAVEEPTAADRYQAGTIDGTRPGEYQINAGRWVGQRKGDLEAVVFHETIPGHHLEATLSLERPDAHLITKLAGNSAFGEGWGLYAERLADEMGLYSSDVDRLGMWQSRAFRAARLVVDTGLHAFGWPRQRAIDFMKALHLGSDEEIASEVDRYIIWPGQATAYMIGALEIERLRREAETRQGPRFDVRAFHERVLGDGRVPLPVLRRKLERPE